jgi:hypothetical protein
VHPRRSLAEPEHGPHELHHRQRLAGPGRRQLAQDALGLTGRARRVQHGRAVRFAGDRGSGVLGDHCVIGFPSGRQGARAGHQHALETGAPRGGSHGHLSPGGRAEQHFCLRVGHDVRHLFGAEIGIDQGVIQAGPFGACLDFKQLRAVLDEDRDVVSPLQSGIPQQVRYPVAAGLVLAEGDGFA